MKYLLALGVFLAGCGGATESTANVAPAAVAPPLVLTLQNASRASTVLTDLEAQDTSLEPGPITGSNGTPLGVMQDLLQAYGNPPPGSAVVPGSVRLVLADFVTPTVRLTGPVTLTAAPDGTILANYLGLRATPAPPIPGLPRTYQLDGAGSLRRTGTQNQYNFEVTVTDVEGGGTARLASFAATAQGTNASGLLSTAGALVLDRFQGFSGRVVVTSPAPIGFATSGNTTTATSGQVVFQGTGALSVTVPSPGQVQVALDGTVVP